MGVDPGLVDTGFGVLEADGSGFTVIDAGVVSTVAAQPLEARLNAIHAAVHRLMADRAPGLVVVEDLYTEYKFPRTAILMGHARGVIYLAARRSASPCGALRRDVKRSITGMARGQARSGDGLPCSLNELPRPSHVPTLRPRAHGWHIRPHPTGRPIAAAPSFCLRLVEWIRVGEARYRSERYERRARRCEPSGYMKKERERAPPTSVPDDCPHVIPPSRGVRAKYEDRVILEAAGVGYEVYLPPVTQRALVDVAGANGDGGPEVALAIHYHATQNQPRPVLIGFTSELDKEFFEKLITVKDVGPPVAARALAAPVGDIAAAIARQDEPICADCRDRPEKKNSLPALGKVRSCPSREAGAAAPAVGRAAAQRRPARGSFEGRQQSASPKRGGPRHRKGAGAAGPHHSRGLSRDLTGE